MERSWAIWKPRQLSITPKSLSFALWYNLSISSQPFPLCLMYLSYFFINREGVGLFCSYCHSRPLFPFLVLWSSHHLSTSPPSLPLGNTQVPRPPAVSLPLYTSPYIFSPSMDLTPVFYPLSSLDSLAYYYSNSLTNNLKFLYHEIQTQMNLASHSLYGYIIQNCWTLLEKIPYQG